MIQTTWLALGAVAAILTVGVTLGGMRQSLPAEHGAIGAAFSLALWGVWTLNAYDVEVVTQSGEIIGRSYDSLAFMGMGAAAVSLVVLVMAVLTAMGRSDLNLQ